MPIVYLCGISFMWHGAMGTIIWLGPPVALAVMGNKKLFEGKSIIQWGTSMIKFFQQPKRILDGQGKSVMDRLPRVDEEKKVTHHMPFRTEYIVWTKESLKKRKKETNDAW